MDLPYGLTVRGIIKNDADEILIVKRHPKSRTDPEMWELPGGKVEKGEDFDVALVREIKEETGIELNLNYKPKPFFEVAYRNNELCSRVLYFFIHTDLSPDLNNTNYTRAELENNFTLRYVPLNDFEAFINKNKFETQEPINKVIDDEIIEAFKHLPL